MKNKNDLTESSLEGAFLEALSAARDKPLFFKPTKVILLNPTKKQIKQAERVLNEQ